MQFKKFAPLVKVNESTREIDVLVTSEVTDLSKEKLDWETTRPFIVEYSESIRKATEDLGVEPSLGNVRLMHKPVIAGKFTGVTLDDAVKAWTGTIKVKDGEPWQDVLDGHVTGVSIGGDYIKRWADPIEKGVTRYTASINEVSLVDRPCNKDATFLAIRKDGESEMRKFAPRDDVEQRWDCGNDGCLAKHAKKDEARSCLGVFVKADDAECACCADDSDPCDCATKDQDGAGACACHAYCAECVNEDCGGLASAKASPSGDLEKISTAARNALPDSDFALPDRRYPIDTKARAKAALSRVSEFGTAAEQKKVRSAVKDRYPSINVGGDVATTTDTKTAATAKGDLRKSLWNVSSLTSALTTLLCCINDEEYEETWEAIESIREGETPDPAGASLVMQLKQLASDMFDAIEAMLAEERAELDDDVYGGLAMAAVAGALRKSPTAKQLIKSLRVHKGNGSMVEKVKETTMSTTVTPVVPEEKPTIVAPETATKAIVCNDPDGLAGDHVHSGGVCKAEHVTPENAPIMKALVALSAKIDGDVAKRAEEATKFETLEATVDKLAKGVAFLLGQPAEPQGALRDTPITKAADAGADIEKPAETGVAVVSHKPTADDKNGVQKSIEVATAVIQKGLRSIKNPAGSSMAGADIQ